jgi:flagellar hook assembly protein FlgD
LSIYDASGRLVRALSLPQSPTPDPYPLTWDGTTESGARAAPGIYYARLATNHSAGTARLILAD